MAMTRACLLLAFACLSTAIMAQPLRSAHERELLLRPMVLARAGDDHSYFRPSGSDVSGFPKNDAKYHRSPCPCMNSLANHGYIPRDGKNLTPDIVKRAIMEVYHLDDGVAQTLVNGLPAKLTLADLGVHNFIEHDASLVHDDLYFGQDPSQINTTLVDELLSRADAHGRLTVRRMGQFRHDREVQCKKTNPEYSLDFKHMAGAYLEAAAFLLAMGDYDSESISVDHARSFLQYERIPDDFERSKVAITTTKALYVAAKIRAMSTFPWEVLRAY